MGANQTVEQDHTFAWGVIAAMLVLLAVGWLGIWLLASPIQGL